MAVNPSFVGTAHISGAHLTTANLNTDGTGAIVAIFVAGANGSRVDRVKVKCTATSVAGLVNFFTYDGVNYRMIHGEIVGAVTMSATVPSFETDVDLNLFMPTGYTLYASTTITQNIDVTPTIAGDL